MMLSYFSILGFSPEDIEKFFELGVLGTIVLVCLLAIIKGLTKSFTWFGAEILLPVKQHLIAHLEKTGNILEAIQKTNAEEQKERHQTLQTLSEHTQAINRIDRNVAELKVQANQYFQEQHLEHQERKST